MFDHLNRCIDTLESSLVLLMEETPGSLRYEVYRNAVIKGFELVLEIAGKMMRRALQNFEATPRDVDKLVYKDVLRHAARHGLMDETALPRWFDYHDNRNTTAHDYGEAFATETLAMIPSFVQDARGLSARLQGCFL